jgi:hypothetical protein
MPWPPDPSEMYLPASAARPVFQGDVFHDVPFTQARAGNRAPDGDPSVVIKRRTVAVTTYPCEMYDPDGTMGRAQAVAAVRSAEGITIPPNWDGGWTYGPLPDLYGDGQLYVVDFRAVANIDRSYLVRSKRVRSLSEYGWAIFRQRRALHETRAAIHLEDLLQVGTPTWQEITLWQRWTESGRPEGDFQAWLSTASPNLGGLSRRRALERGMSHQVGSELD